MRIILKMMGEAEAVCVKVGQLHSCGRTGICLCRYKTDF